MKREVSPVYSRNEFEMVREGVNLTVCAAGHAHYVVRYGNTFVVITFRGDADPVIEVEKDRGKNG